MSQERHPKRQRKKERAAAQRQARIEAYRRAQRRRRVILAGVTAALIVGGAAIAFLATNGGEEPETPAAEASPTPSPAPTAQPIACGGSVPPEAGTEKPTFEAPVDQDLARGTTFIWRLETSCGTIDVELANARAPQTVNSIVFLTRQGYYDGLTFHRAVGDFVVQGGDPSGDGTGGPGYQVTESPPEGIEYTPGTVAMAKGGADPPGTSGSQFFIVTGAGGANLTADYALVGEVVAGMDVAEQIEGLATPEQGLTEKVYIVKAEIIEQ